MQVIWTWRDESSVKSKYAKLSGNIHTQMSPAIMALNKSKDAYQAFVLGDTPRGWLTKSTLNI
jgi:hypothetical protein